jgi:hypothetical protein
MKKFTLNHEDYFWTGSGWLNSSYIKPSRQIIEELNVRFGHLVKENRASLPKPTIIRSQQPLTIQATIAPVIAEIIFERFAKSGDYVTRAEIVEGLIARSEIQTFLLEAHQNTTGQLTFEEYVGNQVDFFSKGITEGYSPYVNQFEQEKIEDKWAYKPVTSRVNHENPTI